LKRFSVFFLVSTISFSFLAVFNTGAEAQVTAQVERFAPSLSALSAGPETEWNKTYGGTDNDYAYSMVQTSDGGYAIVGETYSFGVGGDFWLVKTDAAGNAQWFQTYGGTGSDWPCSLVQTDDGGYALAGTTMSFGANYKDFRLVKTDSSGNMQWNKTYGGMSDDEASSMVQTSDGGYVLAGETTPFGSEISDLWLVKTDSAGNMQWNRTYGGTDNDHANSVVQTADGGYALAGGTQSFRIVTSDIQNFWLVKIDAAGNVVWNKTYGGIRNDYARCVVQTADGGYVLAGNTFSLDNNWDLWLVRTDSSGNMQWNRTYGGASGDYGSSMVQTSDGGYAIAGSTSVYLDGYWYSDFWLVKTDAAGNAQWNITCGGTSNEAASSVVETSDRGYALAGRTDSFGAGGADFWLVKVAGDVTEPEARAGQDQTVNVNATVSFDAGSSTDNVGIVSYKWNFGDETFGTGKTATHVYANAGTYIVTLTVEDAAGNLATDTMVVTVNTPGGFPWWIAAAVGIVAVGIAVAVLILWRREKKT